MLKTEDIEKIAHLARLEIAGEEIPHYAEDLSGIISFVEQLSACDTTNVGPMAHPLDTFQRLRPDEVTEPDQRERFQAIAPQVENGLYLVPQVIE